MGNYGMLFTTNTGNITRMAPLFDNGLSFMASLNKEGATDEELSSQWTRGYLMPFARMMQCFVRDRHREALERLRTWTFTESPFIREKNLRLTERFLQSRSAYALRCLDQLS